VVSLGGIGPDECVRLLESEWFPLAELDLTDVDTLGLENLTSISDEELNKITKGLTDLEIEDLFIARCSRAAFALEQAVQIPLIKNCELGTKILNRVAGAGEWNGGPAKYTIACMYMPPSFRALIGAQAAIVKGVHESSHRNMGP
jgi:hypothetical protein